MAAREQACGNFGDLDIGHLLGGLMPGPGHAEPSHLSAIVTGSLPSGATQIHLKFVPRESGREKIVPAEIRYEDEGFRAFLRPQGAGPQYMDGAGLVDIAVVATGPSETSVTYTTARLRTVGDHLAWTDPSEIDARGGGVHLGRPAPEMSTALASSSATTDPAYEDVPQDDGASVSTEWADSSENPTVYSCTWSDTGAQRLVQSTFGTSYPVGNSTSRMAVSSSRGGRYGLAVNAGSGYEASGSRFLDTGWTFVWPRSGSARSYRKELEYHKFKQVCTVPSSPVYMWRAVSESGGVDSYYGIERPAWPQKYCVDVDAGTWARDRSDGNAYSHSTGVKFKDVIGIDLSLERQYGSTVKLEYEVAWRERKLCGNNAYPASAGKIKEWQP